MSTRIVVEGQSLEEAKKKLHSEALHVLSEEVLSDGKPTSTRFMGSTIEEAFSLCRAEVALKMALGHPLDDSDILSTTVVSAPEHSDIRIQAPNEDSVRAEVGRRLGDRATVIKIELMTPGRKGLLGIGKLANLYDVRILLKAIVEISFKTNARISAEIGTFDELITHGYHDKVDAFVIAAVAKTIQMLMPSASEKEINRIFQKAMPLFYREWKAFLSTRLQAIIGGFSLEPHGPSTITEEEVFRIAKRVVGSYYTPS